LIALVVGCFLLGVAGMSGVAWRAGLLGRGAARNAAGAPSSVLASPSASGATSPGAPSPSAVDMVAQSPSEAPRTTLNNAPAAPAAPSEAPSVPPLVGPRPSPSAAARTTIDASNGRPGLGQPVDFVARISNASRLRVEGARFQFSGPGLLGASEVPASDDGTGAFRTTFTFLQPGRFDVRFAAHADGSPLSAARSVLVGDTVAPTPAPRATADAPAPAASAAAGGQWL
jgi:hypothetical protein